MDPQTLFSSSGGFHTFHTLNWKASVSVSQISRLLLQDSRFTVYISLHWLGVGWCWLWTYIDLPWLEGAGLQLLDILTSCCMVNSSPRGVLGTSEALGALRPASSGDKWAAGRCFLLSQMKCWRNETENVRIWECHVPHHEPEISWNIQKCKQTGLVGSSVSPLSRFSKWRASARYGHVITWQKVEREANLNSGHNASWPSQEEPWAIEAILLYSIAIIVVIDMLRCKFMPQAWLPAFFFESEASAQARLRLSDKGGKDANGATYISVPGPRRIWYRALPAKKLANLAKSCNKQSGQLHSYTATYRLENVRNFLEQMHGTQMPRPIHSLWDITTMASTR